jgi:hypothetical protein
LEVTETDDDGNIIEFVGNEETDDELLPITLLLSF